MSIITDTVLTIKGYSIPKTKLSEEHLKKLEKELIVAPITPQQYVKTSSPFSLYMMSSTRYYLPRHYGIKMFGKPEKITIPNGDDLREELAFTIKLREYQKEIEKIVETNEYNGIISVPCGYGKTLMSIKFARNIGKKFLVIVHKEFLMAQWMDELSKSLPGIKIGKIQGEKLEIGDEFDCAIGMIQTLCSRTYASGTFSSFGFAIFDECHHLGAEVFSRALQQIHTKHMIGLSATPDRSDGLRKVFEYYLGPIIYQIKKRDADKSVQVKILNYTTGTEPYCDTPTNWKGEVNMPKLVNLIAEDNERNNLIVEKILPILHESERQTLILSDRREHLTTFFNKLTKDKKNPVKESDVGFYLGGMKQTDLDNSATKRVILGTFAMAAEGMNIPTLNTLLLATPKGDITQSVGRILRQKPEERKTYPLIIEVVDRIHDNCVTKFYRHSKFYKTCGYKVSHFKEGGEEDKKSEGEDEIEEDESKEDMIEHVGGYENPFLDD
jgi:superfamily II DNA or RNA helicase